MNGFLVFAFLFFIGSCLGWCIELFYRRFISSGNKDRKWINPGFLTGPYLPLYGFGLWGMFQMSYAIKMITFGNRAVDTIIVFISMAVIMTVLEYAAGIIFIKGMKVKLWDYSREKLNFQGIICPKFTVIWGILGMLYYFTVNTRVELWVNWLSQHLAFSFFVGVFFGVFAVDLCYTMQLSAKIRKFAMENQLVIRYEELKRSINERRESLNERDRFIMAFKTEGPFKEYLENYLERSIDNRRRKIREAREDIEKIKSGVKKKIADHEEHHK